MKTNKTHTDEKRDSCTSSSCTENLSCVRLFEFEQQIIHPFIWQSPQDRDITSPQGKADFHKTRVGQFKGTNMPRRKQDIDE